MTQPLRLGRWPLPVVLILAGLGLPDSSWAADRQKQVLVLYSTRRDAQIAVVGDRDLPRILDAGLPEGLDYYSEYIDQGRFPDPEYQLAFRDFLRLKYKGQRFDVVIAIENIAVEFVDKNRSQLFPDTQVVFFVNNPSARRVANATGVIAQLNLGNTLALAAQLQPGIRQVFVVSGADFPDKAYENAARAQFRSFENRFAFTYLAGLATNDLEARLAKLPEHSIVYYLLVDEDGAGEKFHPLEYVDRIVAVANAPTYCWVDSAMDHGIVGGSLKSQEAETKALGALALRVLQGERADSIPPSSPDLNIPQVDWRQLRRWGISDASLPAGTLVRFREPTAWERYKVYILGAVVLLLAQTALIAGLLIQRARRRQAEAQVRGSQAELRASYDRIRDLGGRLLTAQEAERSRIARELHDDVSQQVALLAIDLEILSGVGPGRQRETTRLASEAVGRVQSIARSVHDLSHRLHPAKLQLIGLVAALNSLQRELSQQDISITFTHDNVPAALPHDLTLCLFRVVQEALQNAVKHSAARAASVHLSGGPEGLVLNIIDDGVGFDVDAAWGKGLGLISMSERLEAIGATLKIRSKPGAGTRVEVAAPVRAAPAMEIVAV